MIVNAWRLKYKKRKPKKPIYRSYEARNARLSGLGYESYRDYLESDDWKKLRAEILGQYPACRCCQKKSQVVHHMSYSDRVLLGLLNVMLVSLCHECHEKIEVSPEGRKRDLHEANGTLYGMAIANGKQRWVEMVLKAHIEANAKDKRFQEEKGARDKARAIKKSKEKKAKNKAKREAEEAKKKSG